MPQNGFEDDKNESEPQSDCKVGNAMPALESNRISRQILFLKSGLLAICSGVPEVGGADTFLISKFTKKRSAGSTKIILLSS